MLLSFRGIKFIIIKIYNLYINNNRRFIMTSMELVGLNTKWYRYQNNMTQEQFANKTKFKMAYISTI